jgi:hypothetical protein
MEDLRVSRKHVIKGIAAAGVLGALGQPTSVFAEKSGPRHGKQGDESAHVRWDIVNLDISTTPFTLSPGGVAQPSADANLSIQLTGSGTFVAPSSEGASGSVTGGGTWETFGMGGVPTGSGTYQVTGLASWQFANLQTATFIDLIGKTTERANGNAVLRISYSDGSEGVLGVGCHGPGAPVGIQEGVIATKGYFTYWTDPMPVAGVNKGRTVFHLMQ